MKTLIFIMTLMPIFCFAKTEIIESGDNGFSHIDPLDDKVFMTVRSNLANGNPVYKARCMKDPKTKQPVQNYFIFKMPDANGVMRNYKVANKAGYDCARIERENAELQPDKMTTIRGCKGFSVPEIIVEDPATNQCGTAPNFEACRFNAEFSERKVEINLNEDTVKQAREECGGDANPLMLVRDSVTNHSLFNNLSGESFCNMGKRRVFMDGMPWDGCVNRPECKNSPQTTSPYLHLYTSNNPGFNIGAMTNPANPSQPDSVFNYHYDFEKKSWCQHVLPDFGNTSPTCDPAYGNGRNTFPTNYNRPIAGVIKLEMQGQTPVAYIGKPKNPNDTSKHPELDENQPLIKVTLMKSSDFGALTVFESKPNKAGATLRTMTVSPTYTFGSRFNLSQATNSCDKSMCLRAPATLAGTNRGTLSCSNNFEPIDITQQGNSDVCYSCNGVSPGKCSAPRENTQINNDQGQPIFNSLKKIIDKSNVEDNFNMMNRCMQTGSPQPQPQPQDPSDLPTIDQ